MKSMDLGIVPLLLESCEVARACTCGFLAKDSASMSPPVLALGNGKHTFSNTLEIAYSCDL